MKKYIGEIGLFAVAIIWGGGLIAAFKEGCASLSNRL